MAGLFGGGVKKLAAQPNQAAGLNVQTSAYGKPIPIVYGTTRIAGNLIWYGDFKATPQNSPSSGSGKGGVTGGGGKGGGATSYQYSAAVMIGLCEGPITGVANVWSSQTETTAAALSLDIGNGNIAPGDWSYLTNNHPDQALSYSLTAWAAGGPYQLGTSAQLPNLNFEIRGALYATAPNGIDADPSRVVTDLLTNAYYGVGFPSSRIGSLSTQADVHAIPSSAPYTITVSDASSFAWNLSVEDGSGNLFTAVSGSPAQGQYSFSAGVYTFNSADAGKPVTISYAALGGLTTYQDFTLASGLWISPAYDTQTQSSSMMDDLATYTYAEFVWSSGVLGLVPRGTVAVSGNGYSYSPPSAPLFDLTDDDFLPNTNATGTTSAAMNDDPVILSRTRAADQINDVQVEFLDRSNQYAPSIAEVTDQALMDAFGRRGSGSQSAHMFCDAQAANTSAQLLLQKQYIRNTYSFTLDQRYALLDPMGIVTLTDSYLGLSKQWVRITEITENDDGTLSITAEEYPTGTGAAAEYTLNQGQGYVPNYNADPGSVNAPIFFEPPDALAGGLEVWVGISGQDTALWGGCDVYVSYDGQTYTLLDRKHGAARMGLLTAALPSVTTATTGQTIDPGSTLSVDLSESAGQLLSASQADALALNSLCYVDGELLAYQFANLTGTDAYNLSYLVRGSYDSSIGAHAAGSNFLRLDDGVFKIPFTQDRIGQTLYIKLVSFNLWEGGLQNLSDIEPYSYTITGAALSSALPDVTNLTTSYVAGNTYLTWDEVADFRPVLYEIRKGTSFQGAQVLGRVAHPPFAAQGDGTYWVSAYSQPVSGLKVYSETPQDLAVTGSVIVSNVIASYDEKATGWTGTVGGAAGVTGGNVEGLGSGNILSAADYLNVSDILGFGGPGSGTYEIPTDHQIDIGRVAPCAVNIGWTSLGQIVGQNVLGFTDYLGTTDLFGYSSSVNTDIYPEIALSQDGTTWGAWQKWVAGSYSARKFKARMQLITNDPQTIPVLEGFTFAVDVPDRDDHYVGLSIAAAGTTITFKPDGSSTAAAFNGGPNSATTPNVQVTILDAQAGDLLSLTGVSLSQCTIQVLSGGVGVARTVNVLVQGF